MALNVQYLTQFLDAIRVKQMKTNLRTENAHQIKLSSGNKPYQAPSLQMFGKLHHLTQGQGTRGGDGGSGMGMG